MSVFKFNLDLHSSQSQVSLAVKQGDTDRAFQITLSDGGEPYILPASSVVTLLVKKPSGYIYSSGCIIKHNSLIEFQFTEGVATDPGINRCELAIYGTDNELIASPNFTMIVSNRAVNTEEIEVSTEDVNKFDTIYQSEAQRNINELGADLTGNTEGRVYNEKQRVENENLRNDNEFGNLEKGIVGRKYAEKAREDAENGRKTTFEANESARQESYERAEENRGLSYTKAENQRDERYESAESKRDGLFNDNESDRYSIFGRAEEERESSYIAYEKARDDLYRSAESKRQEDFRQSEAQRQTNEATRISKENERISNENTRISNENTRIAAENARNSRYEEAENSRNSAYSTAENTRNSRYESAESVRNTSYTDAEAYRDEWYHDAENQREDLYEKTEGTRWEDFNSNEAQRDAGEKSRVEAEEKRSVFYKDFNSRITQIENHIDPKYYITSAERAYERIIPANACPYIELNDVGTGLLSIDGSNKYSTEKPCDNLIPFPYYTDSRTVAGITYTVNADGSIQIKGTASGYSTFVLTKEINLVAEKTYSVNDKNKVILNYTLADGTSAWANFPFTWQSGYTFGSLYIQIASGTTVNEVIYPMLNEGTTALPYEPYYAGTKSTKVTAIEHYGANLVDDEAFFKKAGFTKQSNGYWLGSNKTIHIFTNTERKSGSMSVAYMSKTLTANGTNNSVALALIYYTEGSPEYKALTTNGSTDYGRRTYTTDADRTVTEIWLSHGIPGTFEIKDLIINWGGVVDYKPYSAEPIFTIDIPKSIQNLNGYGFGTIDFDNMKFIQDYDENGALSNPIITDISAYLSGIDNTFEVQAGGTLRFVNEAKAAIPSTISYLAKEGSV